jgi:hypothetical protein
MNTLWAGVRRCTLLTGLVVLLSSTAAGSARADALPVGREAAIAREGPASGPSNPARRGPPGTGSDLTHLSLEELLSLEITQINVLGSHTHLAKEWMVSYRAMFSEMSGYRDGRDELRNRQVLRRFPTIHTRMSMREHMLELMYAPTDRQTVMLMVPYMEMTMRHLSRSGHRFTTESNGIGDVTLMHLANVAGNPRSRGSRWLINSGLTLPSGSVSRNDDTPTVRNARLEYAMQTGSGTVDLLPGVTLLNESEQWSLGGQFLGTVRLGRNTHGYRFGNRYRLSAWAVRKVTDWLAPSVRLDAWHVERVKGSDPALNPLGNPESNPMLTGGRRIDILLGLHFYVLRGSWKGTRFSLEGGVPIYQQLNGPQLDHDWQLTLSASRTF